MSGIKVTSKACLIPFEEAEEIRGRGEIKSSWHNMLRSYTHGQQ